MLAWKQTLASALADVEEAHKLWRMNIWTEFIIILFDLQNQNYFHFSKSRMTSK